MFKLIVGKAEYTFYHKPWAFGWLCYEARRQWAKALMETGLDGMWSPLRDV